jgi:hypothetical protein
LGIITTVVLARRLGRLQPLGDKMRYISRLVLLQQDTGRARNVTFNFWYLEKRGTQLLFLSRAYIMDYNPLWGIAAEEIFFMGGRGTKIGNSKRENGTTKNK